MDDIDEGAVRGDSVSKEGVAESSDKMEDAAEEDFIPGFPTLEAYSKALLENVVKATKSANALPTEGDDFDYYSSFPGFKTFCSKMSSRVNKIVGKMMRHYQLPCYWTPGDTTGGTEDVEERFEVLLEANDILLERVGTLLDEAAEVKTQKPLLPPSVQEGTAEVASWNKKQKDLDREMATSYRFIHTKSIERPQLKFRDHVDNSNAPFIPLIRRKPNALKPLPDVFLRLQKPTSLNAIIANAKECAQMDARVALAHPYQYELEHYEPLQEQLQLTEPKSVGGLQDTPFTYVDTLQQLEGLQQELSGVTEFAVDLEAHWYRSYQGFVCLMQVSTRCHDYIVDTLALREHMQILLDVFTNPKIVKVMHGADWDIPWLQRDFGIYVVNLFDTGQASRVLALPKFSLAYLLQYCCDVQADKQYQLADWRIRPLPEEMMKYAREDTHYLLYIYDRMRNELVRRSNKNLNLVHSVLERSRDVCLKLYTKPLFTEDSYLKLHDKHRKQFNPQQQQCLKLLCAWRDRVAREQDESTNYVLPNHMLFQIAEILPREPQGVLACCNPIPTIIRQELNEIFRLVQQAREEPAGKLPTVTFQMAPPPLATPTTVYRPKASVEEPDMAQTVFAHAGVTGPAVPVGQPSLSALAKCASCAKHTEKYNAVMAGFPSLLSQFLEAKPMSPSEVIMLLARRSSTTVFGVSSSPVGGPRSNHSPQTPPLKGSMALDVDTNDDTLAAVNVMEMVEEEGEEEEEEDERDEKADTPLESAPPVKRFKKALSVREMGNVVQKEDTCAKAPPTKKSKVAAKDRQVEVFDYEKAQFTDFLEGRKAHPSDVFDPSQQQLTGRKERFARSRINLKSGERAHTFGGGSWSRKRQSWPGTKHK